MNQSITKSRHAQLLDQLPSYADMHEVLERILPKFSGSEQYKIRNIMTVLEQAAKLITSEDQVKEDAEKQLNEVLR